MSQSSILVCVCTYNEIENIPLLVEGILEHLPDADILVVDDNSPDGTGSWCKEHSEKENRLKVLIRKNERGLGSASIAGLKYAIKNGYERVVTMDADFSHSPDELAKMTGDCDSIDVVVGSRYVEGGKIEGWPFHRRIMSRLINLFARMALRLPVRDCSGAFRNYRVEVLKDLDLENIQSRGYCYLEEILWRLKLHCDTFREVPIVFRDRVRGQTKINLKEAIAAVWMLTRFGFKEWFSKKQRVSTT